MVLGLLCGCSRLSFGSSKGNKELLPGLTQLWVLHWDSEAGRENEDFCQNKARLAQSVPSAALPCLVQRQLPCDSQNRPRRWEPVQNKLLCSSGSLCSRDLQLAQPNSC